MAVILGKELNRLEPAVQAKAYALLSKLNENPALPGLRIKPIQNTRDKRVRAGRVDQMYRAVLFRLDAGGEVNFVVHGIWPHDEAIAIAQKIELKVNPVAGVTEILETSVLPETPATEQVSRSHDRDTKSETSTLLASYGYRLEDLTADLGLDQRFAERILTAVDEDTLLKIAATAPAQWQGLAVLDLASGLSVEDIKDRLGLAAPTEADPTSDEAIVEGLRTSAGQAEFAWIESSEELERVINEGDFGAWRVFLHPEQRRFVDRDYRGSARVTGGAGTGKTVVVLHRARALASREPIPRVLVTTFTRNLADMLEADLRRLDPDVTFADHVGGPGVTVRGIDALAAYIVRDAGPRIAAAAEAVLGVATTEVTAGSPRDAWADAIESAGDDLPPRLRNRSFLEEEYAAVVLPNDITTLTGYLRVRRPGRGVALDRAKRAAVWKVVEAYRARARAHGHVDFAETTALAAKYLRMRTDAGQAHLFDHVPVDEAQDLSPSHWRLLRAAVPEGPNDIFISEDTHQRIYAHRIVLSHYGIRVVGRARRLTLNYRTTAQNLRWAMAVLDGGDYADLAGEGEDHTGYRSARSGPPVEVRQCADQSEELDVVAEALRSWLDAGDPGETLAVLVRDGRQQERVVARLEERGIRAQSVGRGAIARGRPAVMTMHRSKGTEFGKVVLFGIREGSVPAGLRDLDYDEAAATDGMLRERSLLYVVATRARDLLLVTWSGRPSPLLGH